jgi:hypothetical protein
MTRIIMFMRWWRIYPICKAWEIALILEGTSMAGTESAWDFVADDAQLLPSLHQIQRPDGSIPHFEVVLGTNNMSGSAGRNAVLAWRVL